MTLHFRKSIQLPAALRAAALGLVAMVAVAFPLVGCAVKPYGVNVGASEHHTPTPDRPAPDFEVRGRIYFIVGDYIVRWSSGSIEQFSQGTTYESPRVSPDGRQMVAVEMGLNHSELVLLNGLGERINQLTNNLSPNRVQDSSWARSPAWSPDGRSIAFVADLAQFDLSIWRIPAGGGQAQLVHGFALGSGGGDTPTWSPDGNKIAFTGTRGTTTQIVVADLNTGQSIQITNTPDGAYDPAWSPSGDHIAFVVREDQEHNIWMAAPDGSGAQRLFGGGLKRAPTWSADGEVMIYLGQDGDSFELFAARVFKSGVLSLSQSTKLTNELDIDVKSGLSWRN